MSPISFKPPGNAGAPSGLTTAYPKRETAIDQDSWVELKFKIHQKLIEELDPSKLNGDDPKQTRAAVEDAAATLLANEDVVLSRLQQKLLVEEIADEILGLGPLEPLLKDDTISEIMVNAHNEVYGERDGVLFLTGKTFRDDAHIMAVLERIIAPLGRRIDEASPMVDARTPGGYRVNAIIPPLSLRGPTITIRKFFQDRFALDDLVRIGTISEDIAEFLAASVKMRLNMIVSGGTGTGKTTFLNSLSAYIPETERIVSIEDPCELILNQRHWVRLETRPPTMEGKYQVTQRDLVRNALRMRPDRIIVGEVRSGEAFDMLQAMNTGHDGSLSTVHSNTPRDAISRIENMVLMANLDLPVRAIREQIASAIHLIVHLNRFSDGTRKVTEVTEVVGMEGQTVTTQDIFVFDQEGVDEQGKVLGTLQATGIRPRFTERFEKGGVKLRPDIFMPKRGW
ncbi:MAG: CpaF family protein [Chloroflexi bacterium]|nr:CpaF family protein [Chloroflexota bacterium]